MYQFILLNLNCSTAYIVEIDRKNTFLHRPVADEWSKSIIIKCAEPTALNLLAESI